MKKSVCFFAVLLVVFLGAFLGCNSTRSIVLNPQASIYPKINPDDIRVFMDEKDVPFPFEKLAILEAKGNDFSKDSKLLKNLKVKAAAIGANGLILEALKTPTTGDRLVSLFVGLGGLSLKSWTATAIRFKSPG
jgi:hypothetical protein